jgi:hypothetical protein
MDKKSSTQKKNISAFSSSSASSNLILWKLLVPLVLAAVILISVFSGILWWDQNQQMNNNIQDTAIFVSEEYDRSLVEQSFTFNEEINWILKNDKFRGPLEDNDSEKLRNETINLYARLSSVHKVTAVYFHGPDRMNILRIHDPEQNGDFVDHFLIREAERTGNVTAGLMLGSSGVFTYSIIEPIYEGEKLIGYVELNKKIEDLIYAVAQKSDSEIAVFFYKDELDRPYWESGMRSMGDNGNWSLYPAEVLTYSTMPIPEKLDNILKNRDTASGNNLQEITQEIQSNGKIWDLAVVPLMDASKTEVGYMIVMKDVTEDKVAFISRIKMIIMGAGVVFGLLFAFYFVILDKTDKKMMKNRKELMDSEEKFRNIFEGAVEGIGVSDIDTGKFRYVNPALCNMLGYTEEELMQIRLNDLHSVIDSNQALYELENARINEKTLLTDVSCICKDGTTICTEISAFHAIIDGKNCMVVFYTDVTALKKINEEIQDIKLAKLAADESNHLKTEFLANMSHELRTPLNSIIGFSDVLQTKTAGTLNEKQSRYITNISNSGKHLLDLINNILDISKIEAGKMEMNYEEVDISSLFEEVKNVLDPLATKKNIKLEYSMNEQVLAVCADKIKLKQILYNLVNNAIKFTDTEGNVSFTARTKNDMLYVSVIDDGIGISENDRDKLFKPFMQLHAFNAKPYQGTGLGLSLVKKFTELHGGEVWVTSKPDEGSNFTFSIPVKNEQTNLKE